MWSALGFMACAALVAGAFQAGPKLWDQTTVAWVQAVGSILAVAAVGAVASWQAGEARRLVHLDRSAYRTTIAEFADEVASTVEEMASRLASEPEFMAYEGISHLPIKRVREALPDFEATRLVSAKGALAMRDLVATVESAEELERTVTEFWRRNGDLDEDVEKHIRWWRDRFRRARETLWVVAREVH